MGDFKPKCVDDNLNELKEESDTGSEQHDTGFKTKYRGSIKLLCLSLLTGQTVMVLLAMRYVRTRPGDMFMSTTAVVMAELSKVVLSFLVIMAEEGSNVFMFLHESIIKQPMDCAKIAVPALLYVLQNNLFYVGVSNLNPAVFQVTYQLRILSTSVMSVLMLKKKLTKVQWLSLVILTLGVSIVHLERLRTSSGGKVTTSRAPVFTATKDQAAKISRYMQEDDGARNSSLFLVANTKERTIKQTFNNRKNEDSFQKKRAFSANTLKSSHKIGDNENTHSQDLSAALSSARPEVIKTFIPDNKVTAATSRNKNNTSASVEQNHFLGFFAVVACCLISAFSGVYFEKILKETVQSVWIRNIQLGSIGVILGMIVTLVKDWQTIRANGFFFGYDLAVVFVIMLVSAGGIIVAFVVKYADNILKLFAASIAFILSCIMSVVLFEVQLSIQFLFGTTLCFISVISYTAGR